MFRYSLTLLTVWSSLALSAAWAGDDEDTKRLEGKWKVSQNRPAADRAGVIAGLREDEGASSPMAALVERGGKA